uniref:SFRICE_012757 n=1 Tax=Spodoptera frugiperda TaxID=7108 RepID=A0A2H1WNF2_SPOFR
MDGKQFPPPKDTRNTRGITNFIGLFRKSNAYGKRVRSASYASHATDFSLSCIETHTTASTDPRRTDRIFGNAYMRCVLMTSYGMRAMRTMRACGRLPVTAIIAISDPTRHTNPFLIMTVIELSDNLMVSNCRRPSETLQMCCQYFGCWEFKCYWGIEIWID